MIEETLPKDLDTANRALTWAEIVARATGLNQTHSQLYTAICDALTNVQEAIAHLGDAPD